MKLTVMHIFVMRISIFTERQWVYGFLITRKEGV